MKTLAKTFNNPKTVWVAVMFAMISLFMLLPESALAQAKLSADNFKTFTKQGSMFATAITLGFGLFAFIKWIEYFSSWGTGNALTGLLVPGIATFLTFQWNTVLGWFGLA